MSKNVYILSECERRGSKGGRGPLHRRPPSPNLTYSQKKFAEGSFAQQSTITPIHPYVARRISVSIARYSVPIVTSLHKLNQALNRGAGNFGEIWFVCAKH
jgi:hypothetical protein